IRDGHVTGVQTCALPISVPRVPQLQTLFEHKFYWDELYDWVFYRPSVLIAKAWTRWIERPLISGSAAELALGTRESGRLVTRVQIGRASCRERVDGRAVE